MDIAWRCSSSLCTDARAIFRLTCFFSTVSERTKNNLCKFIPEHDYRRRFTDVSSPDFSWGSGDVCTQASFLEHKIIFYQVSNTIAWWFARFYGIKTKAMRSINCNFNYNQKSRSEITPRKIFIGVLKYILYQCLLQYVHSVALSGFFSEVLL